MDLYGALLRDMLETAAKCSKQIIICGDFNFPEINWKDNTVDSSKFSKPSRFYDSLQDNYPLQHVTEFTRKRGKDKPSLLDLVITDINQTQVSPSMKILQPLGKSDHSVITWNYLIGINTSNDTEQETSKPPRLNYFKGDYDRLRRLCQAIDWENILDTNKDQSVDDMLEKFHHTLSELESKCIPLKSNSTKKDKPPWLTCSSQKAVRKKYFAWKRFQDTKSRKSYLEYKRKRDKATSIIRKAKQNYEKKISNECKVNPKVFYSYCNFKQKSKKNIIRLRNSDGKILVTDHDNANALNTFFQTVYTKEDDTKEIIFNQSLPNLMGEIDRPEPFNYKGLESRSNIDSINITEEEVLDLLKDIDPNKSSPVSCIHPKILLEACHELAHPITKIFNLSLKTCKVPTVWKEGIVTPIYKDDGDRHSPSNYRPITLTSMLCRILEKLIKKHMIKHLDENELLSQHQHGFRSGKSCLSNLLEAMDSITETLDAGLPVDELFLDLAKAFDKVPHQRLIYKLSKYGIRGDLLLWIESYLCDRKQKVRIRNAYSRSNKVTSGVPQGSVLGPILFLIFINDVPDHCVHSNLTIFADDTKLSTVEDADLLQNDINMLLEWCKEWKMKFNVKKCNILHYGKKNQRFIYHLDGFMIKNDKEEKDLGVYMSENLKYSKQVSECIKKANKLLAMIKRTFTYLVKDIFLKTYKVYVRPVLEYCQEIWSPHLIKDIDALEKVQERATKLVPGLTLMSYEDRLKSLKLYSLKERRDRGDLITMYKIYNGMIDINFDELFEKERNLTYTRSHGHKLMFKRVNGDTRRYSYTQRIIAPWNKLPSYVMECKSVDEFKRSYDRFRGL